MTLANQAGSTNSTPIVSWMQQRLLIFLELRTAAAQSELALYFAAYFKRLLCFVLRNHGAELLVHLVHRVANFFRGERFAVTHAVL